MPSAEQITAKLATLADTWQATKNAATEAAATPAPSGPVDAGQPTDKG